VEHLTLEKLQEESGDRYIWDALNERFPDKQQHDWLAECLREVFQISANEGEGMMAWTSRVQEVFSKCKREVQVDFPTEARGWICLHAAGLTEDQRAIVTAKTQGDMKSWPPCAHVFQTSKLRPRPRSPVAQQPMW
jgi:hypothetical protein